MERCGGYEQRHQAELSDELGVGLRLTQQRHRGGEHIRIEALEALHRHVEAGGARLDT